jgi:DNA-binding Xre family transcriptional regulator
MLDEAFLRPGRIDFTFHVPLPDTKGRREIIDIHTKGKALTTDVLTSLNELAEKVGITNVNLSNIKTGKVSAIRFSTLDAICKALDCQPGDILEYSE